jgi:hypothetical protein
MGEADELLAQARAAQERELRGPPLDPGLTRFVRALADRLEARGAMGRRVWVQVSDASVKAEAGATAAVCHTLATELRALADGVCGEHGAPLRPDGGCDRCEGRPR